MLETWLSALQANLFERAGASRRSARRESPPLTWRAAETETEDTAPACLDREPRGADDETVAEAVPDTDGTVAETVSQTDRQSRTRSRPDPEQQADDEAVARAVARVERSRRL